MKRQILSISCALVFLTPLARGGERPYFITYDHTMEEPGNLEIEASGLTGTPKGGNTFVSGLTELEYGAKGWWTTELYLDGQTTANQTALFTGYRWENRFRGLMKEHLINPVFYVEYEDLSGADKTIKEVVGFDNQFDGLVPNRIANQDREHELETKLILSSNLNGWNVAYNFIAEKNLAGDPWEFGYAAAVSRPLTLLASPNECTFCRENFQAGVEFYGGMGTTETFTMDNTAQYIAPVVSWAIGESTWKIEPTFGLTGASYPFMLRFGMQYEIKGFRRKMTKLFR